MQLVFLMELHVKHVDFKDPWKNWKSDDTFKVSGFDKLLLFMILKGHVAW